VPVTLSPSAPNIISHAKYWARTFRAAVDVVHVIESTGLFGAGRRRPGLHRPAELLDVQNRLARTVECADGPDVDHRTQILFGDPAETITKYAEAHRARLVLMTTGRVGLRKYVLGGVTEAVVRRSRCPVCTLDPNGHTLLPAPDAADPDAADSTLPEIGLPAAGDRS